MRLTACCKAGIIVYNTSRVQSADRQFKSCCNLYVRSLLYFDRCGPVCACCNAAFPDLHAAGSFQTSSRFPRTKLT